MDVLVFHNVVERKTSTIPALWKELGYGKLGWKEGEKKVIKLEEDKIVISDWKET